MFKKPAHKSIQYHVSPILHSDSGGEFTYNDHVQVFDDYNKAVQFAEKSADEWREYEDFSTVMVQKIETVGFAN